MMFQAGFLILERSQFVKVVDIWGCNLLGLPVTQEMNAAYVLCIRSTDVTYCVRPRRRGLNPACV